MHWMVECGSCVDSSSSSSVVYTHSKAGFPSNATHATHATNAVNTTDVRFASSSQ